MNQTLIIQTMALSVCHSFFFLSYQSSINFVVPNVDLPALCSPKFKPGPPAEDAQVLSERLNEVVIGNGLIPLSSLCICSGKSAWVLYVDATVINYDGNAFDATLLAMVCALRDGR